MLLALTLLILNIIRPIKQPTPLAIKSLILKVRYGIIRWHISMQENNTIDMIKIADGFFMKDLKTKGKGNIINTCKK